MGGRELSIAPVSDALEGARARAGSVERREGRLPLVSTSGKAQPQRGQG